MINAAILNVFLMSLEERNLIGADLGVGVCAPVVEDCGCNKHQISTDRVSKAIDRKARQTKEAVELFQPTGFVVWRAAMNFNG